MTTTATAIISQADLDRCIRHYEEGRVYYEVISERDANVSYEVRYNGHYTCTCPSGLEGFANVRNASGVCKHCRWSIEHARRFRAKMALVEELKIAGLTRDEALEAVEHTIIVDGQPADIATLVRVFSAKGQYPSEGEMNCQADLFENRPFQFLR